MMGYGSDGTRVWMLVPALLLLAVVAFGVWASVTRTAADETKPMPGALPILEGRHAKGEITKAEFERPSKRSASFDRRITWTS